MLTNRAKKTTARLPGTLCLIISFYQGSLYDPYFQVQCLEFTVDGSYLISVGNYKENALVLWDMENYAVHTVAKVHHSQRIRTMDF